MLFMLCTAIAIVTLFSTEIKDISRIYILAAAVVAVCLASHFGFIE